MWDFTSIYRDLAYKKVEVPEGSSGRGGSKQNNALFPLQTFFLAVSSAIIGGGTGGFPAALEALEPSRPTGNAPSMLPDEGNEKDDGLLLPLLPLAVVLEVEDFDDRSFFLLDLSFLSFRCGTRNMECSMSRREKGKWDIKLAPGFPSGKNDCPEEYSDND